MNDFSFNYYSPVTISLPFLNIYEIERQRERERDKHIEMAM